MNTHIKQLARGFALIRKQDNYIKKWHAHLSYKGKNIFLKLHYINFKQWHEENKSRRINATDREIAKAKKNIDSLNYIRSKLVHQIDASLYSHLQHNNKTSPRNSETPGSIFDRLSILSLKIYHTKLKAEFNKNHRKINNLLQQDRDDLVQALHELMDDLLSGRKQFKLPTCIKFYDECDVS